MPIAVALILILAVFAVCLIYFLWTLVLLIPVYALIAAAGYFAWSRWSNKSASAVSIQQEAEDQRRLNEQEMRAWHASLEIERRNDTWRKN